MTEKQILTNSSLTTFKTCPRRYQFQYEMGMVPVRDSEALFFGKLMHYGLAEWAMSGHDIANALEKLTQEFKRIGGEDEYVLAKAAALLEGYHERYKDEVYTVVFAEKEFRAPLLNPETAQASKTYELGGVMDRIIQDRNGRHLLLETKTTSEEIEDPAADYWRKLGIDSQISTYFLGAEASLGVKIESCLYDVIRKPTIRPKQVGKDIDPVNPKREETPQEYYDRLVKDIAERPEFYYARREVPRTEDDLSEFLFDTWNVAQSLRQYQLKNKFPRFVNACKGNFGYCQYFKVCSGQVHIDNPEHFKKVENKHQELNQNAA